MDGELPLDEAAEVADHVEVCEKCAARVSDYRSVSAGVREWTRSQPHRPAVMPSPVRWPGVAAWGGAIAAAVVLAVALNPRTDQPKPAAPNQITATTSIPAPPPAARDGQVKPIRKPARPVVRASVRPLAPPAPQSAPQTAYEGPVVRVSLPADELFAPGAVPAGMRILADVTLAADGSPAAIRLLL